MNQAMRLGVIVDYAGGFGETVDLLSAYEGAGLELVAIPEAYSFDAVSQLGFLAARSQHLQLMSAILPVYSRTPALIAMTAAGLDHVSGGRFTLGLGASGPQVVEGFHGVRYDAPLGRTREVVTICRQVWRREALRFEGKHYQVPLTEEKGGSGLGRPLKIINHPIRADIPISVAALGPKNVELVAEIAEGWQPLFFHPGKAAQVWGESLRAGLSRRDPDLGRLDIQLQVSFYLGEPTPSAYSKIRRQLALYIGGMGARGRNFYNHLAQRYGYADEAKEIQNLYLGGRKAEAAGAVPRELVDAVSLLGEEEAVRRQLRQLHAAGVRTLLLNPLAEAAEDRLEQVRRLRTLVAECDLGPSAS